MRIDPDKLIAYGLSIGQVEQQLTNNNANAGGSFIEDGQAADQCARSGPGQGYSGHRQYGLTTKSGTPVRVKDIGVVTQGPEIRLGQFGTGDHLPRRQNH